MSDTTSDNDDLSITQEHVIAGVVILLFGLLYWFLNGNFNSSSQDISVEPPIPLVAESPSADHKTPRKGYPLTQAVATTSATAIISSKVSSPDVKLSATSEASLPQKNSEEAVVADDEVTHGKSDSESDSKVSPLPAKSVAQEQNKLSEIIPPNIDATETVENALEKTEEAPVVIDDTKVADNLNQLKANTETNPKPENKEKEVVPTYPLPDGTPIKISANGFEGELQQLFQNGEVNKSLTFDQVYFDTGSTEISTKSDRQIRVTAALMHAFPKMNILLRGHTDNRGAPTDNFQLSLMRANSMGLALGALGIDTERVRVLGMGDGFPVGSNNTEEGRKKNRRIEILLQ